MYERRSFMRIVASAILMATMHAWNIHFYSAAYPNPN